MTTRTITFTVLLLALAACGSSSTGNAAVGKSFTYGTPTAVSATQSTTLNSQLTGALALYAASDPSLSEQVSDTSGVTSALFGSSTGTGFLVAPTSTARALVADGGTTARQLTSFDGASFDDPRCATTSGGNLTMTGCSVTIIDQSSKTTITADGTATLAPGSLTWDFTVGMTMTGSGFSANAHAHRSGTLKATSTTVIGDVLTELSASASGGGASESLTVSESVSLDLAFAAGCVNAGSLEAKRVWSQRPSDTSGGDYSDRGALVKWTGCGTATIALSR